MSVLIKASHVSRSGYEIKKVEIKMVEKCVKETCWNARNETARKWKREPMRRFMDVEVDGVCEGGS